MKLLCGVCIGNRILPSLDINSRRRHVNSTLVLCRTSNSRGFCVILFSSQNQNGFRYQVNHISSIYTRFVNEGKATIQFQIPEHDLYIQADSHLLKNFLRMLKLAMENNLPDKSVMTLPKSTSAVCTKPVVKKLSITDPYNYPMKGGFPRTLKELSIDGINCTFVDRGILQLTRLRVLDISSNCLTALPMELRNLSLSELVLEHNQLVMPTSEQWKWLSGNLSKSLIVLNLKNNRLSYIPNHLLNKFHQLRVLKLDNNELRFLPTGIGRLKSLRTLTASDNYISVLPASCRKMHLQELDLSNNKWNVHCVYNTVNLVNTLSSFSLKELVARRILSLQLQFSPETLPFTLADELEYAQYCSCGSPCINSFIKQVQLFAMSTIAENFSVSPACALSIPINAYFCSAKCFESDRGIRRRRDIVR